MELEKLLDHCQTLEKTISILVKGNAGKLAEIARLQKCIFDETQRALDELLELERKHQLELDTLRYKKNDLDTEIKRYSDVNEKLSHLVSIVQKTDGTEEDDNNCKNDELISEISETIDEFDQVKQEHSKLMVSIDLMETNVKETGLEIKELIESNQLLIVDVQRNDSIIRLSEQQNKYVEQQFDLILNQLPWEPLTNDYIEQLRKSNDQSIRDLADNLQIQKTELEDLDESLCHKKKKKLEVLEQLHEELNTFVQKRDEAILVTRFIEGA